MIESIRKSWTHVARENPYIPRMMQGKQRTRTTRRNTASYKERYMCQPFPTQRLTGSRGAFGPSNLKLETEDIVQYIYISICLSYFM